MTEEKLVLTLEGETAQKIHDVLEEDYCIHWHRTEDGKLEMWVGK